MSLFEYLLKQLFTLVSVGIYLASSRLGKYPLATSTSVNNCYKINISNYV